MKSLRDGYNAWVESALGECPTYGVMFPGFVRYLPLLSHNALKLYVYITIHSREGQIESNNVLFAETLNMSIAEVERVIGELQRRLLIAIVNDTIVLSLYCAE